MLPKTNHCSHAAKPITAQIYGSMVQEVLTIKGGTRKGITRSTMTYGGLLIRCWHYNTLHWLHYNNNYNYIYCWCYSYNYNCNYTTLHYTTVITLHYATLHFTRLQLQLPLELQLHYTTRIAPRYATLH